ncbi:retinol dehydrogenase 12-like [Diadema antillarum]|uniref:retinol dehydrogenase 12-like n=1 Tax=Diadema antillarum TaxID=105358 RepID=UPI003A87A42A
MEFLSDTAQLGMSVACDIVALLRSTPLPVKAAITSAGIAVVVYGTRYLLRLKYGVAIQRVRSNNRLDGKTVLITGSNAGIGRETAVDLARRGARIIMACRDPVKAREALAEIRRRSGSDDVVFRQLNLSDLTSVRAFANTVLREEDRLDILINNAGIRGTSNGVTTPEGFDVIMGTNHVGHFVLTLSLIELIRKSAPSRIINVSSFVHTRAKDVDYTNKSGAGLKPRGMYERSKLANVLFTKELARRLAGSGVTACCVHPGLVSTGIFQKSYNAQETLAHYKMLVRVWLWAMSETDGAQTTIHCAIDESVSKNPGAYYANCRMTKEAKLGRDMSLAKQLWAVTCEATGIDPHMLAMSSD